MIDFAKCMRHFSSFSMSFMSSSVQRETKLHIVTVGQWISLIMQKVETEKFESWPALSNLRRAKCTNTALS